MATLTSYLIETLEKEKERLLQNKERADAELVSKVKADIDQYVPYNTGNLSSSQEVNVNPSGVYVSYKSCDYAEHAFNPTSATGTPKKYNQQVHSLATGNPIGVAVDKHREEWLKLYKEALENGN